MLWNVSSLFGTSSVSSHTPTLINVSDLNREILSDLFRQWAGTTDVRIEDIPPSGSERRYYRLYNDTHSAIGAYGPNLAENRAFLTFARHFHAQGLNVAPVLGEHEDGYLYLVGDLGDKSLLDHLLKDCKGNPFPMQAYQNALAELVRFQIDGGAGLDYSVCYPRADFDKQSMAWDLNYFKYYVAKLKTRFDEQALEDDFNCLTDYLGSARADYFMYRDFQARNILLVNDEPFFIDFQGGRRGPLHYDLVSLLFQAKARIPHETRAALVNHYLDVLESRIEVNRKAFWDYFMGFVLIRTLQTIGAYGFRGWIEHRPHFLQSLPPAIENLAWWLENADLPVALPELLSVIRQMVENPEMRQVPALVEPPKPEPKKPENKALQVIVTSFSYKKGIPEDPSGNGGGFVFDCRAIHNPGKYEPYKRLTGRDQAVKDFLLAESDVLYFLEGCYHLVDMQVDKYLARGFTNLMVNFGCTGGQHRSVFCADRMAEHLEEKYGVTVLLSHVEQERKNWQNG